MAACKSLRHIFESTIPENKSPSLLDSLSSLNHIRTFKPPLDHHSFTEIFGELHFRENHSNPTGAAASSSSLSFLQPPTIPGSSIPIDSVSQIPNHDKQNQKSGDENTLFSTNNDGYSLPYHRRSESLNSDSLQLCTEGLGSESLGDVEDLKIEEQNTGNRMEEKTVHVRRQSSDSYLRKKRSNGKTMFPPPISYIGQAGKPSVSFQSYRKNGRFVLKEVRIPTQECLRACREDGRLRLSIVQPNNDDEDEDEDENDGDDDAEDDCDYAENDDDGDDGNDVGVSGGEVELEGEVVVKEVDEGKVKNDFERGCS